MKLSFPDICQSFNSILSDFRVDFKIFLGFQDDGFLTVYTTTEEWTAQDEINLLDAVEQYGFGNW